MAGKCEPRLGEACLHWPGQLGLGSLPGSGWGAGAGAVCPRTSQPAPACARMQVVEQFGEGAEFTEMNVATAFVMLAKVGGWENATSRE